ncbi:MAG: hypothetical protein ACKVP7_21965 [Hyphomicrobiaceae bacterium]
MRRIVFTAEAEHTLGHQVGYLIDQGASVAASALSARVEQFLAGMILAWPRTGRYIPERDLWETWIPRTRLVVWYRFTDDELVILTFWHTAQDRA